MTTALKVKFVKQSKEPYFLEVTSINDLTTSEQEELLEIMIRLKKKVYYSKNMIQKLIDQCTSKELKDEAIKFLTINK